MQKQGIELPADENAFKAPEQGREFVRQQVRARADYIKILHESGTSLGMDLPKLPLKVIQAIVESAHDSKLPVLAHAFTLEDTLEVLASGIDGTAHTIVDKPPTDELIEAYKSTNAFCTPTLTVIGSSTSEGKEMQERYAHDPRVQDLLVEGGMERMCQCLAMTKPNAGSLWNAIDSVKALKDAGIDIIW